ncbi:hypothetical protein EMCRGX_G025402 [Ephydatia muelleri]
MATVEKEKFHGATGKTEQAFQKRNEQLKKWEKSETNRQPASIAPSRQRPRVRFGDNIVFLAAAASGDLEDVETLVKEKGADVNCHSKDGLTALHQACIDDNFDMVKVLVSLGASVDAVDNEGWTALHAATSCCHEHIVEYLLSRGAFPAPVNNDGKSPLDLLDEVEEGEDGEEERQTIRHMLQDAINKKGIDVDAAKSEEERIMLIDANKLKNNPNLGVLLGSSQATPLHVAAAKNYLDVLKILLSMKPNRIDVDALDEDGWTPLHAAAYWGNMEAAALLVQGGASLNLTTKSGETLSDLCDSQEDLENLHKLSRDKKSQSLSRSRPPLPRCNSRDRCIDNRPSPVVRRRSSKERVPKNKDMQDEREFMEQNSSEEGDELFDTKAGSDTESGETGTFNHVPESPGSDSPISDNRSAEDLTTPNSKGSPKAGAKKQSMSPQMMKRVHLFEKTTPNSSSLQPAATLPLTSTPLSSPATPDDAPKRFPFKPHTIAQDVSFKPQTDSNTNVVALTSDAAKSGSDSKTIDDKSVSFRKRTEQVVKRSSLENRPLDVTNRASLDVTNRASLDVTNRASLDFTNRASFDGSNIPKDMSSLIPEPGVESRPISKPQVGPEPTSKDVTMTTQGTPTPQSVTSDHQRMSREMSADSNSSDLSRNNSISQDAEAQRKIRAKEKRERRKPTQPVSQEMYDQLFKPQPQGSEDTVPVGEKDENELSLQDSDDAYSNDSSGAKAGDDSVTKGSDDGTTKVGEDSPPKGADDTSVRTAATPVVHQSAYRPSTRPSPRIKPSETTPSTQSAPFWTSMIEPPKANSSIQQPPSQAPPTSHPSPLSPSQSSLQEHQISREERDDILDASSQLDESASLAERSRSKSNARRKHREKRRVTGIPTEVGDNEDIPENVRDIFGKKPAIEISTPNDQDLNMSDEVSPVAGDEALKLQKALEDERAKSAKIQQSLLAAAQETERVKEKVAELQRRCEDTNRAYEQASGEAARKQTRIDELEKQLQDVQGLKNENQRIRDENSALIRVIGKLSRGPPHA